VPTARTERKIAKAFPHRVGGNVRRNQPTEELAMSNEDDLKGRVKEAAGDLTGDKDLKREGQVDQAAGKVKEAVDDAAEKAKDALTKN
jgi:uncharacterized protein YjbJ (UPF0337 family)